MHTTSACFLGARSNFSSLVSGDALDSTAATPLHWHSGNVDGDASADFLRPPARVGAIVQQNLGGEMAGIATEQIGRWLRRRTAAELTRCRR